MDPAKDADGLHPVNLGRLVLGAPAPLPCTPRGIVELLRRYDVPINGAEVCVVGRGVTVGRPLGLLLTRKSDCSEYPKLPARPDDEARALLHAWRAEAGRGSCHPASPARWPGGRW